ncbi:MAG: type I glyceraldehyde-3-phosphate dehydrogenase [Rhodobacteraceae bacterium]|nr:type I glyceraldehyde-3-phosphate dehydrogenase [Paracoccaceae bacterium]
MTLKVAINGFGRIGRCAARLMVENFGDQMELVALNASGGPDVQAHLLKYDSVHGRFGVSVGADGDNLKIGNQVVRLSGERDPAKLDWDGIDLVLECTGAFNTKEAAQAHIARGAKRVLCSAPAKNADKTVVYGVNHEVITADDLVVSAASCTTNCLAPVAKVMHDSFGIEKGFMTTIHAYTGDQPTLDRRHKDPYRGRAAAMSMIPTTTGAAKAVGLVLPALNGRLDGAAIRVPTPNVSCVDLTFTPSRKTSVDEVNEAARAAAFGAMAGVLDYDTDPTVSVDYNHSTAASTFAAPQTRVMDGDLVRVLAWYDNEWGFTNQMLKAALVVGGTI